MEATDVTLLLREASKGGADASRRVFDALYRELRALAGHLMQHEPPGRTLQPTALVHEASLRLLGENTFENRRHFMNVAAQVMRRILIDHARARSATRRGGGAEQLSIEAIDWPILKDFPIDDVEEVESALETLGRTQPRARDVVHLRYYCGLTQEQVAEVLGVSLATVKNDWAFARPWLKSVLDSRPVAG